MKRYKKFLVLLLLMFSSVFAFAEGFNFDLTLNYATKYLWRGQKLYYDSCLQPNFNFYIGSFTINYFGVFPFKSNEYIESDYSFIATEKLPFADFLNLSAGFTIYTFPNSPEEFKNSLEIFGGLTFNTIFTPYLKLFYDALLGSGYYLEGGINYSFDLNPFAFNLYSVTAYNFNQWGYNPSFTVLLLTPEIVYTVSSFTFSLSTNIQIALNEQYANDLILNTGIKFVY